MPSHRNAPKSDRRLNTEWNQSPPPTVPEVTVTDRDFAHTVYQ